MPVVSISSSFNSTIVTFSPVSPYTGTVQIVFTSFLSSNVNAYLTFRFQNIWTPEIVSIVPSSGDSNKTISVEAKLQVRRICF